MTTSRAPRIFQSTLPPGTLEVLRYTISALADEMSATIVRTCLSPTTREAMDFAPAISDVNGRLVAQGFAVPSHVGAMPMAIAAILAKFPAETQREGDIFVTNDPYTGGCSHLPDVFFLEPIFHEGKLLAFGTVFCDQIDIGGIAPGGRASHATEIFQEGLRLPPIKICAAGTMNDAVWDIIATNVRMSDMVLGDLRSSLAALHVGKQELLRLADKWGADTLTTYFGEIQSFTEFLVRREFESWPDGRYEFEDYIEGPESLGPDPIPIHATIHIAGDEVWVDLAGSSPQVAAALNCPAPLSKSAIYAVLRRGMKADIPLNDGLFRAVHISLPEASIVNPSLPAACNARGVTSFRIIDTVQGALSGALPERLGASGDGGSTSFRMGGALEDGTRFIAWDTMQGSTGGQGNADGIDGCAAFAANLANVPVEVLESEFPVRINRYEFAPDTGGGGEFRGGLAVTREWELLGPQATFTIRADRERCPSWGVSGGGDGTGSRTYLLTSEGESRLPAKVTMTIERGTVIRHTTAGAGGFGNPHDRPAAFVLRDCREGKVSLAAAQEIYGVVIADDAVDELATGALRSGRPR